MTSNYDTEAIKLSSYEPDTSDREYQKRARHNAYLKSKLNHQNPLACYDPKEIESLLKSGYTYAQLVKEAEKSNAYLKSLGLDPYNMTEDSIINSYRQRGYTDKQIEEFRKAGENPTCTII